MKAVGNKFGRLTIIEKTDKRNGRNLIYKCQCDCGNIVEVPSNRIGIYTNSCGCLKNKEKRGKGIGNGWTVDVIAHILKGVLNNG